MVIIYLMFFMLCMTVAYNIFEFRPSPEWWSEVSRQVHGPFLPCRNCNHIFFFKVVQNLFYQTLECAGPKKKFFEDSTLKAQNSIANFDIKANKARHPLASTRFFTELLEFRDKREEKKKKKQEEMEWFYPKRRGPEWKQGWTGQTMGSVSSPPLPLLAIFGIVISLLWLSHYTGYKAQLHHSAINLQIFLVLLPILLILFMASYSTNWLLYYRLRSSQHDSDPRSSGSFPWGIAIFVVVLLMLLSYRSTFHSKWFGLLQGSD